jgi:hypothetical protein
MAIRQVVLSGDRRVKGRISRVAWQHAWLAVVVAVGYFLISRRYVGPAYLADEVGYLSNAAFLGGHHSDGANSYYGGYSLLISPLFRIFSDPGHVWQGVMAVNAVMWGATFWLIASVLVRLYPDVQTARKWLALTVVAFYPASVAMSGYAFSQTAFALCFAGASYTLLGINLRRPVTIIPHAVLVGYLYWIHPTGLAACIASLLAMALTAWHAGRYVTLAFHALIVALMVLGNSKGFEPWLVSSMTPAVGGAQLNEVRLHRLFDGSIGSGLWLGALGMFLGQLGYLAMGTFGFLVTGAVVVTHRILSPLGKHASIPNGPRDGEITLYSFSILAIVGIAAMSAVAATAVGGAVRLDHWLYGRYVEPTILLLFAIGLVSRARVDTALVTAALLLGLGFWLSKGLHIAGDLNQANVPALWAQLFFAGSPVHVWFALAAAVVAVAGLVNRTVACVAIICVYMTCGLAQFRWHQSLLEGHSNPTAFVEFIELNYPGEQCVGFDVNSLRQPGLSTRSLERAKMYSYYFFAHPLKRSTPHQWFTGCDGPLLTFDPELGRSLSGIRYVGRETTTNLFLVVRDGKELVFPKDTPGEQYWAVAGDSACVMAGCFAMTGQGLSRFSKVGVLENDRLASSNRGGYLFFGPYASLDACSYELEVRGEFATVDGVYVDVASDRGRKIHLKQKLLDGLDPGRKTARFSFDLDEPAHDLEVRMGVTAADRAIVEGYSVRMTPPANSGLAGLPHQVGVASCRGLRTNGRQGYLAYGPYRPYGPGRYRLIVNGNVTSAAGAWLDVASSKGTVQHAKFRLSAAGPVLFDRVVELSAPVADLEVRVFVTSADELTISGYSFEPLR